MGAAPIDAQFGLLLGWRAATSAVAEGPPPRAALPGGPGGGPGALSAASHIARTSASWVKSASAEVRTRAATGKLHPARWHV